MLGKLYNISELAPQQSFPKFMELQGDTTFFYMKFEKLKCLNGKENIRLLNVIGVSCKGLETAIKDVEMIIQTGCYSAKEEESLTETSVRLYKQMKTKTCLYHQMKSRSLKQLSVFTMKFITSQE